MTESLKVNNFQGEVIERAIALARNAKVCGFVFYCLNVEKTKYTFVLDFLFLELASLEERKTRSNPQQTPGRPERGK